MEIKADKILVIAVIAFMAYLLLRGHSASSEHAITANLFGIGNIQLDAAFSYCNLQTQPMETSNCAIPLASDYLICSYCHKPTISCYSAKKVFGNEQPQTGMETPAGVCSFNKASSLPYCVGGSFVDTGLICVCANKTPLTICNSSTQQGGTI
jgi:hypothetical protein